MSSASASVVSRATIEWMRKLIQLLPEESHRLLKGASRVLKAVSFTLDSMVFASRAISSAAAARHTLWLMAWPTIYQDKAIVTAYPFQSDELFGGKVLVEMCDKIKAMPQSLRSGDKRLFNSQTFRTQHTLPHFCQDSRRPTWGSS